MSIIKQSLTSIGPKSGFELAESIGADRTEGVQIALFPSEPTEEALGPEFAYAPGVIGRAVIATFADWGPRVLDIVLEGSNKGVKWWKVRDYAKDTKQSVVPVSWQGPIVDIPEKYFTPAMGVRFFNSGPWFWPIKGTHLEDNLRTLEVFCKDLNDDDQTIIRGVLEGNPNSGSRMALGGPKRG